MSSYALIPLAWLVLLELSIGGRSLRAAARSIYLAGLGLCIRARIIS